MSKPSSSVRPVRRPVMASAWGPFKDNKEAEVESASVPDEAITTTEPPEDATTFAGEAHTHTLKLALPQLHA
jgi:hypothetical protein